MFFSHLIAERKIQEAILKGELDNLPGKGKPLQLDDDSGIRKNCDWLIRF